MSTLLGQGGRPAAPTRGGWQKLAGWSAIAAAILTVTGLLTLLAFFGTGSALLGVLNDLNTIAMAVVTVPLALALYPVASRTSVSLARVAMAADLGGVPLVAGFSALLVLQAMTFDATLTLITVGNGLIGVWLLVTAALLAAAAAVPSALGWLGIAGGAGLALTSLGFPLLGREHPVIAVAGLVALVGLVGFYAWAGVLLLRARLGVG
ncbi:MAG TPA: hypothetical protein VFK35_12565 [Candidatus Limnocylindrales bacterium]|nr:hypothetical protein [Candidatus Limnocylindrales bacterium]